MENILKHFPKQIGTPARVKCNNIKEYYECFVRFNGSAKKNYTSLYDCPNNEFNYKTKIHLVAFDLDSKNRYENTIKIHNKLMEMNLKHCLIFSTFGFWVYVLNKNYEGISLNKDALYNAHEYLGKEFGLTWGDSKIGDLDKAIKGDIARISRMIGSYDIDRGRYCIPVTIEDLHLGEEHIYEKAQKSSINIIWYGTEYLDFSKFDYPSISKTREVSSFLNIPIIGERSNVDYTLGESQTYNVLKFFLPIVRKWFTMEGGANWKQRYYATVYLVQLGLEDDMIDNICKRFFQKNPRTDLYGTNYNHWKRCRVLSQARKRNDFFPRLDTLYNEKMIDGITIEDLKMYNNLYFNTYSESEIMEIEKRQQKQLQEVNKIELIA